jgi:hypothetical protein
VGGEPDRSPPRILRLTVALRIGARLGRPPVIRLAVDEAAAVTAIVERRVGRRWVRVRTARRSLSAGASTLRLAGRLRAGRHRIRLSLADAAGNRSTATAAFRVR